MELGVLWVRVVPSAGSTDAHVTTPAPSGLEALGTCVVRVGGTEVIAFPREELARVVEVCLTHLTASQSGDPPRLAAIALGDVTFTDYGVFGAAFDRAQALCHRAGAGELVVSAEVHAALDRTHLFARQVGTSSGLRGHVVDHGHPVRAARATDLGRLRASMPTAASDEGLSKLRLVAGATGQHRVVLRGPMGAGAAEWIEALVREFEPALVLRLGLAAGANEPLGSLRWALRRAFPDVRAGFAGNLAAASVDALRAIRDGEVVPRDEAVAALRALLGTFEADGARAWLVFDPMASVDAATTEVLAAALDGGAAALCVGRLTLDGAVPPPIDALGRRIEIVLPPLKTADALALAGSVLGETTDPEIVRRIAVLGGDSPLGIVEAARTLIAAGDLVADGDAFRWRAAERRGTTSVEPETWLAERTSYLEDVDRRVLEAVCALPAGADAALVVDVAARDGIDADETERALARLRAAAFLLPAEPPLPTSELLRHVVTRGTTPARTAEVARHVRESLFAALRGKAPSFASAAVAHYDAEGGNPERAGEQLWASAQLAASAGYRRIATRMAARAAHLAPSVTRTDGAAELLRSTSLAPPAPAFPDLPAAPDGARTTVVPKLDVATLDEPGERETLPGSVLATAPEEAARAMASGDAASLDATVERAVAAGVAAHAAAPLRAVSQLLHGDPRKAYRTLERARDHASTDADRARATLALSVVALHAAETSRALRAALAALASTRRAADRRGEIAALRQVAACFRAIGRDADAARIDAVRPG